MNDSGTQPSDDDGMIYLDIVVNRLTLSYLV
jgi:hypothetical protein